MQISDPSPLVKFLHIIVIYLKKDLHKLHYPKLSYLQKILR